MSHPSPTELATTLLTRPSPPNVPSSIHSTSLKSTIDSLPTSSVHPLTKAALHLANDDIHACHAIVGKHEGDEDADLLHLTMHRREGDFWNSAWWINNIPAHTSSTTSAPSSSSSSSSSQTFSPKSLRASLKLAESVGKTPGARSKNGEVEDKLWEEMGEMVRMVIGRKEGEKTE